MKKIWVSKHTRKIQTSQTPPTSHNFSSKHYLVRADKMYVLGSVYHALKHIKFSETARNIYFCKSCLKLVDLVKNAAFLCVWTYFWVFGHLEIFTRLRARLTKSMFGHIFGVQT